MIKTLSKQVAQDLCAQQVITNICDCIKQLVDNSIDAKSTSIQVLLLDYGKKCIEIIDNGCGIDSFQFLAKKGSTSKNKGIKQEIYTLGFRGQALHSLGKVSQKMIITSAVEGKNVIEFDVKNQSQRQTLLSRSSGTTVKIQSLFQFLPVRRYELLNKCKEFLKKTDEMIKQYSLIYPQISFILKNTRDQRQDLLISTTGLAISSSSNYEQIWSNRIAEVLGQKVRSALVPLNTQLTKGWILKNIQSGSSRQNTFIRKNIHYMYLNSRPVDPLPKIVSVLDSYYKKYNRSTKYVFIINLILPWSSYDVNLTPSKREILIKQDLVAKIIEQIKQFIDKNVIQDIPVLKDYEDKQKSKERMSNFLKSGSKSQIVQNKQKQHGCNVKYQLTHMKQQVQSQKKYNSSSAWDHEIMRPATKQQKIKIQQQQNLNDHKKVKQTPNLNKKMDFSSKIASSIKLRAGGATQSKQKNGSKSKLIESLNQRMSMGGKSISNQQVSFRQLGIKQQKQIEKQEKHVGLTKKNQQIRSSQQLKTYNKGSVYRTSSVIKQQISEQSKSIIALQLINPQITKKTPINSITTNKSESAMPFNKQSSQTLQEINQLSQRIKPNIDKSAFDKFQVMGQFNHGFIVCYFEQKYYLVDQHAASEKYHFQKIMKSAKNQSQIYKTLQVSQIEVDNVQQHKENLEQDGYRFQIKDDEILLMEAPVFLEKVYGKEYFLELASSKSKLSQHPDYYSAAATKACRTAVMVGDVLQISQMKNIVEELSKLNSPWNCPHGRPTLIYLGSRVQIEKTIGQSQRYYCLE